MLILLFLLPMDLWAVRVKDIASLRGARDNQLIGFGIVVGLDGTGDSAESLLSSNRSSMPSNGSESALTVQTLPGEVLQRSG